MPFASKIKICGLTNLADAQKAVELGADFLGFNFYPESPRYIPPEQAITIIRKLPTFVDMVAVFVNASAEQIQNIAHTGYFQWVQLHGDEKPEFCLKLHLGNVSVIKAIRVRVKKDLERIRQYPVDAVLLDAYQSKQYGGTGKTFNWDWIKGINERIFLAGGINPDNIVKAIQVGVYAVDVCSGVEEKPGKKDHDKMKKLFEAARYAAGFRNAI